MQCSCCRAERTSLTEYSIAAAVGPFRKTIETLHLCAVCRIVYLIKPAYIAARVAQSRNEQAYPRRNAA